MFAYLWALYFERNMRRARSNFSLLYGSADATLLLIFVSPAQRPKQAPEINMQK